MVHRVHKRSPSFKYVNSAQMLQGHPAAAHTWRQVGQHSGALPRGQSALPAGRGPLQGQQQAGEPGRGWLCAGPDGHAHATSSAAGSPAAAALAAATAGAAAPAAEAGLGYGPKASYAGASLSQYILTLLRARAVFTETLILWWKACQSLHQCSPFWDAGVCCMCKRSGGV